MSIQVIEAERGTAQFSGLRMNADEFLQLPDDGCNYELVDGVVVMSPSPTPPHQECAGQILTQLMNYLRDHPVGKAFMELDVHLGQGAAGKDLVYRPEVIFVRSDRLSAMTEKIVGPPDLVVEVISRGSRRIDSVTKKADYERFGVMEYWLIDPQNRQITFFRMRDGRWTVVQPQGDTFMSEAVPGFRLDLRPVHASFEPWVQD